MKFNEDKALKQGAVTFPTPEFIATVLPATGTNYKGVTTWFRRLILYTTPRQTWIHKDFRG